jgi:cell division protein FtsQ
MTNPPTPAVRLLSRPDSPRAQAGRGADPRRRLILGALAVVLVGAVLAWLVAFSSVFGVRTIRVNGTHVLTVAAVRNAAHIEHGTPLIRLDTAAVARRVEALPDVASASVSVSYPSTVVITVRERLPVGYVETGGAYRLVDRTGDQYRRVGTRPRLLPKFVVPSGVSARTTGGAVATVAADLPAALLRRVASIQALDPAAITLVLTDGRIVRWGSVERSADKARILPTLLSRPGRQFDVTDPDQPFAR